MQYLPISVSSGPKHLTTVTSTAPGIIVDNMHAIVIAEIGRTAG